MILVLLKFLWTPIKRKAKLPELESDVSDAYIMSHIMKGKYFKKACKTRYTLYYMWNFHIFPNWLISPFADPH